MPLWKQSTQGNLGSRTKTAFPMLRAVSQAGFCGEQNAYFGVPLGSAWMEGRGQSWTGQREKASWGLGPGTASAPPMGVLELERAVGDVLDWAKVSRPLYSCRYQQWIWATPEDGRIFENALGNVNTKSKRHALIITDIMLVKQLSDHRTTDQSQFLDASDVNGMEVGYSTFQRSRLNQSQLAIGARYWNQSPLACSFWPRDPTSRSLF